MSDKILAKELVGELISSGFKGESLSKTSRDFFKKRKLGGAILFKHNYESPEQVAELINSIQDLSGEFPFWVSVDHEGGRVQRFRTEFTLIPSARAIAKKNDVNAAFQIYSVAARELKAVGINLNFCPVADINTNPLNPVIGDRAYGETEESVSKFVEAAVKAHLSNGVEACLKHFPGHGDTSLDSHFALPQVDTPLELLKSREWIPFQRGIAAKCKMIMSAHVINPLIDPKIPATLSRKTLSLLRSELGFRGMILSDDMEMKAIADHFGANHAPVLAIEAGCDHLLYRSEEAALIALDSLTAALDSGTLSAERVIEAATRSKDLKKAHLPYFPVDTTSLKAKLGTEESEKIRAFFN